MIDEESDDEVFQSLRKCMTGERERERKTFSPPKENLSLQRNPSKEKFSFAALFIELIANEIKINKGRLYRFHLSLSASHIAPRRFLAPFCFFFSFRIAKSFISVLFQFVRMSFSRGRCESEPRDARVGNK